MTLPAWKCDIIRKMKTKIDSGRQLVFVHTPKCAGQYCIQYFKGTSIINNSHTKYERSENTVAFTVIRDPVKRFESYLNYILQRNVNDPTIHIYANRLNLSLDDIVRNLTLEKVQCLRTIPFRTLAYYTENVDLVLTIDEFLPALTLLGYDTSTVYPKYNVSYKLRGTLNEESKAKIREWYKDDIELFRIYTVENGLAQIQIRLTTRRARRRTVISLGAQRNGQRNDDEQNGREQHER